MPNNSQNSLMEIVRRLTGVEKWQANYEAVNKRPVPYTGWIETDEWLRVTDYSFTTPADTTVTYEKGTKIAYFLPAGVSWEYGVVISSTYNAGTELTTVTLATNTDYAMTDTPVRMMFSRIEYPYSWPDWFNYLPTYGDATMTFTGVTTTTAKFRVSCQTVMCEVNATGTTGGVATTSIAISTPITANAFGTPETGATRDAAAGLVVLGQALLASAATFHVRKADGTNYGLGAGRIARLVAIYQMV